MRHSALMLALTSAALVCAAPAKAEQTRDFGEYVIHYTALPTTVLSAHAARLYVIERGPDCAILNLTVLKKHLGLVSLPVKAEVSVSALHDEGQSRPLPVREVTDGGAIYYIVEFPMLAEDTLDFRIRVVPQGGQLHTFRFEPQLFPRQKSSKPR